MQNTASGRLPLPRVVVGQVWKDRDPRSPGRYLKVESVESGGLRAVCCRCTAQGASIGARESSIAVRRFRPISTGYDLVIDA